MLNYFHYLICCINGYCINYMIRPLIFLIYYWLLLLLQPLQPSFLFYPFILNLIVLYFWINPIMKSYYPLLSPIIPALYRVFNWQLYWDYIRISQIMALFQFFFVFKGILAGLIISLLYYVQLIINITTITTIIIIIINQYYSLISIILYQYYSLLVLIISSNLLYYQLVIIVNQFYYWISIISSGIIVLLIIIDFVLLII